MAFDVRAKRGKAGDREGDVYELTDGGTARAEVWPQWGFNCIRWQVKHGGGWADVMFHMPDWETNPVPTRSGQPILFPFPGRLREGKLHFEGKTYELPLNEGTKKHAIHGFTPRTPWRVVGSEGGAASAAVTGEFTLATDFPESLPLWPNDFVFRVTYRLFGDRLRVEAHVKNPGPGRLPFGLGYHGYFRLPGADADIGASVLKANVAAIWEAEGNLPTGRRLPVPAELDFQQSRALGATALDNVFTQVTGAAEPGGGLVEVAALTHPTAAGALRVLADRSFRELVLFIPAHRNAVAIEPYTCAADANNLAARGIDSGWLVLEPGAEWDGVVEYRWEAAKA